MWETQKLPSLWVTINFRFVLSCVCSLFPEFLHFLNANGESKKSTLGFQLSLTLLTGLLREIHAQRVMVKNIIKNDFYSLKRKKLRTLYLDYINIFNSETIPSKSSIQLIIWIFCVLLTKTWVCQKQVAGWKSKSLLWRYPNCLCDWNTVFIFTTYQATGRVLLLPLPVLDTIRYFGKNLINTM